MARFIVDMCADVRIAEWLRNAGHDVKHLRDENLHRLPNGEIFKKASAENRIVVTFDLDFGEIISLSASQNVSAIVFRLRNTRTHHVIDRLTLVLPKILGFLESGAIVIIEEMALSGASPPCCQTTRLSLTTQPVPAILCAKLPANDRMIARS